MLLVSQVSGALWLVLAVWRVHFGSCHGNDRWQGREEADNSSHLVAAAALGQATCLRTAHCAHALNSHMIQNSDACMSNAYAR